MSLALCLSLSACSGAVRWQESLPQPNNSTLTPSATISSVSLSDQLMQYYTQWSGVPYVYGGQSRDGIDCSAYVQQAAQSVLGVRLPRTTSQQLNRGHVVESQQAISGDLVFFQTGPDIKHVGILLGNNKFMHASTTRGVSISRIDDSYWQSRLIGYRRVISLGN